MKVKTSKGFTLAELLIVMAIITVLAAVAVPSFAKQLETSHETADLETLRNAYTEAYTQALQDVADDGVLGESNDTSAIDVTGLTFTQKVAGFDYVSGSIAGSSASLPATVKGHNKATFTFALGSDGGLTLTTIATSTAG